MARCRNMCSQCVRVQANMHHHFVVPEHISRRLYLQLIHGSVREMRKMDWVRRHEYFEAVMNHNLMWADDIRRLMGPDELYFGKNEGVPAANRPDVIPLGCSIRAYFRNPRPRLL